MLTVSLFYLAWGQFKAILNRSRIFAQLDFDKTNCEQMILKLVIFFLNINILELVINCFFLFIYRWTFYPAIIHLVWPN